MSRWTARPRYSVRPAGLYIIHLRRRNRLEPLAMLTKKDIRVWDGALAPGSLAVEALGRD